MRQVIMILGPINSTNNVIYVYIRLLIGFCLVLFSSRMYIMRSILALIFSMVAKKVVNGQDFLINPRNFTTFQLHGAYFVCEASANNGVLQWKLPNGQLIDKRFASNKWYVSETQQGNLLYTRLDIQYSEVSDVGRYECVWMSADDENINSSAAYLQIVLPTSRDTHLCDASSIVLFENNLVTVTCAKLIDGNDHRNENDDTLRWVSNEMLGGTLNHFIRVDNWNSRLWYNIGFSFYASPHHNNIQITCTAIFSDNLSHECVVGPISVLYRPEVNMNVVPNTVRDGDEVVLTCDAQANPVVHEHEWYINGYLVDETEGYIIKQERLYIPNVDISKHDSLIIGCFAINTIGRGQGSVLLRVDNSLQYVGPMVSGILFAILLIAGLVFFCKIRNKKSLRIFLRSDCVRASFKWQNEYIVKSDNNQNEFMMNNYRRRSRKRASIVLHKYHTNRESDEARSTSITSGRETTISISSFDSKDDQLSTNGASTSGINQSEKTQTSSALMSCSSSVSQSISPVSFEENVSEYEVAVIKQTDLHVEENSKLKNKQLRTSPGYQKVKNTDVKTKIEQQSNEQSSSDIQQTENQSRPTSKTLAKWTVKDITFEEVDESVPSETNVEWPVAIDQSTRYNKSRNAKLSRARHDSTRGLHDSTRALWNNAGFVPISTKASNSGKIRPHGIYVKKHQKAIGSLYNQLNVKSFKQERTFNVNVAKDNVVKGVENKQDELTQF